MDVCSSGKGLVVARQDHDANSLVLVKDGQGIS